MEKKACSVCKMFKSLDEFPRDNRAKDGRASNCKQCQSAKRKAWADKQESKPKVSDVRATAILQAGEKRCSKCGEVKPLTEYHKDARNKDGFYGHCKACHYKMTHAYEQTERGKAVVSKSRREWYEERGGREITRARSARPSAIQQRALYRQTEAGKEAQKRKDKKRVLVHPQKIKAKNAVNHAVASGILPAVSTMKCVRCGNQAEHYHHESYAKEDFLRVIPLCQECHARTYTQPYK